MLPLGLPVVESLTELPLWLVSVAGELRATGSSDLDERAS
jgi:hypothetical protein